MFISLRGGVRVHNSFNHFSVINISHDYIKYTDVINT